MITQSAASQFANDSVEARQRILERASILADCDADTIRELARQTTLRQASRATLMTQGEPADAAYFIGEGRVRLFLFDECGREINVAQLRRGDFFGESALFAGQLASTTAMALTDVTLVRCTRDAFATLVRRHPGSLMNFAAELNRRSNEAHRAVAELAFQTVEGRLVRTLRRWGLLHGGQLTDEGLLLRRRPTHHELAQMTGSSRETITRTFSSLTSRRLLVKRGSEILLRRPLLAEL